MVSAAAHVCMYVCMYVCMWRATRSQEVTNQADKPANKRQVLRALVVSRLYNTQTKKIIATLVYNDKIN